VVVRVGHWHRAQPPQKRSTVAGGETKEIVSGRYFVYSGETQ